MPMLFDPFEQLREFQRAIDAFRSSGWLGSGVSAGGAYPPINIFRKGDDIIAIIEVPGVRKSDLDIRIESNTLRISGSKTPCCMDRRYGRTEPDPCSGLCDADVLRASQLQHSVQYVD